MAQASGDALEAAGLWLFQAESINEKFALMDLAERLEELLDLVEKRGDWWCREDLAGLVSLRAGRPQARLLALARREPWARQTVAHLPPDMALTGGLTPAPWLARLELGRQGAARARRLAAGQDWPGLAGQGEAALVLAQALAGQAPAAAAAAPLAWPGGDLGLLEEMARITAQEGRAAADLALAASRELGRVVVLMGNASLGAPPLWAVPGPWREGRASWTPRPGPRRQLAALGRLRAQRLGVAALRAALHDMHCCLCLGQGSRRALHGLAAQARDWLSPHERDADNWEPPHLGLGLGPWASAVGRGKAALARLKRLDDHGRLALGLVWGLAAAWGTRAKGEGMVLPWADKFVASTLRSGDHQYLAGVAGVFARLSPPPLLLLLDETRHPAHPSLGGALAAAQALHPDLVLRGLGAFASQPEPGDPLASLLEAARGAHLVALRPLPGSSQAAGLVERLAGRALEKPLAPASRDAAPWLLSGTSLGHLGDPQEPRGRREPAPWLLTTAGFAPLGAWFRRRVMALAGAAPAPAGPWRRYQRLCNLA